MDQEEAMQRALVSLASRSNEILYSDLMAALNIDTVRRLEDFVIRAISSEVIKGRLNPREQKLELTDWSSQKIGDDLNLDMMEQTLNGWIDNCNTFVSSLREEIERSNQYQKEELSREKWVDDEVNKIRKQLNAKGRVELQPEPSSKPAFKNDAKRYKTALRMKRPSN